MVRKGTLCARLGEAEKPSDDFMQKKMYRPASLS